MRSTHVTPDGGYHTTPSAQLGQHVPAPTPDEQLVVAYLAACVCCWRLQLRDLTAVEQAIEAPEPLSLEQVLLAETRLDRCLALAQTMQEASRLIQRFIMAAAPHIQVGFRLQGTAMFLPFYEDAHAATQRVQWCFLRARAGTPALRSRALEYVSRAGDVRRAVMRLLATLSDPELPVLAWEPPDLATLHSTVQIFKVWVAPTTSALSAATTMLRHDRPSVLEALELVHRAAELVRFWHRLVDLFQPACASGNGTVQPPHEAVLQERGELSAIYQQALAFYEALVQVLVERNVLTPEAPPASQAQQIAAILLPSSAGHPQAAVAALCRAALLLDARLVLWHQHVLAVDALIGNQGAYQDQLFPLLHNALERLVDSQQQV